jgi:hypothetical protein
MQPQGTTVYKTLEHSSNYIFFENPKNVQINEDAKTRYATSSKIEVLIEELKEKGPLVASGQIGPDAYVDKPFKLKNKIGDYDIYGWKPGSARKEFSQNNYLLILGAKKIEEQEIVYFTLSEDATLNTTSYIRQHKPSHTDSKIYAVSNNTFKTYLFDLYPPVQPIEKAKNSSGLVPLEQAYAQTLASLMPLDSILDRGAGERKCKEIGQKAFDEFKKNSHGDSWAASEAVIRICDSMLSLAPDGKLRKQYVEKAWDGIGDDTWSWMS